MCLLQDGVRVFRPIRIAESDQARAEAREARAEAERARREAMEAEIRAMEADQVNISKECELIINTRLLQD